nr:MAG TPA: hypothetical protein [Caudoviricetes sp.]
MYVPGCFGRALSVCAICVFSQFTFGHFAENVKIYRICEFAVLLFM